MEIPRNMTSARKLAEKHDWHCNGRRCHLEGGGVRYEFSAWKKHDEKTYTFLRAYWSSDKHGKVGFDYGSISPDYERLNWGQLKSLLQGEDIWEKQMEAAVETVQSVWNDAKVQE
jgi:hypothetical protein